jgi:hypothetical protein
LFDSEFSPLFNTPDQIVSNPNEDWILGRCKEHFGKDQGVDSLGPGGKSRQATAQS